jgi:hypothetical protein
MNTKHNKTIKAHGKPELPDERLANELLRDLVDGKGWNEARWAKRGLQPQGQHSPLPWNIIFTGYSNKLLLQSSGKPGTRNIGEIYKRQSSMGVNDDTADANAQLIVASVNHAQALAEALRDVMSEMESRFDYESATHEEETAFLKAREALAKWEGAKINE